MAKPIELGLVLEGEDAKEFWENERQPATKKQIEKAWNEARPIRTRSREVWRKDSEGNYIRKGSYGTHGKYGWDVDHIKPKTKGGSDNLGNLQALHWKANIKKSDKT